MANDINIVVSADARSATQNLQKAQKAVNDLDRRIKRSTGSLNRNANAYNKTAVATNKFAKGALQQAGYQFGDFFVQVGGGTSALQAFGQQGAQLAGVFGPIGAVIGAGIALFSAVAVAIQKTSEATEEASGKVETFADRMNLLEAATSKLNDTQALSAGNLEALQEKYGTLTKDVREFLKLEREAALLETTKQLSLSFEKILDTSEYKKLISEFEGVAEDLRKTQADLAPIFFNPDEAQAINQLIIEIEGLQEGLAGIRKEIGGTPERMKEFSDAFMEASKSKNIEGMKLAIVGVRKVVQELPLAARNALIPMVIQMEGQVLTLSQSMVKGLGDVEGAVTRLGAGFSILGGPLKTLKELQREVLIRQGGGDDLAVRLAKAAQAATELARKGGVSDQGILAAVAKNAREVEAGIAAAQEKIKGFTTAQTGAANGARELARIKEQMLEPMRRLVELQRELAIRESGGGDLGVRMAKAADAAKALAREGGMLDPTKLQEIAAAAADVERKIFFAENSIGNLAKRGAKTLKNELDPAIKQIQSATEAVGTAFENSLMGVIDGTMSVKDAFKSMAVSIITDLYRIFVVKQITGFISKAIGSLFGPIDTTITPGVGNSNGLPASFNGGGYTGNGARAGGLDGKGGRMAMIHPRETILDHTKGQSQGVTVVQNINVSAGVAQTVRAEMTTMLPQIGEYAKAAVLDARKRGGAYGGAFA